MKTDESGEPARDYGPRPRLLKIVFLRPEV